MLLLKICKKITAIVSRRMSYVWKYLCLLIVPLFMIISAILKEIKTIKFYFSKAKCSFYAEILLTDLD